jgi:Zn-dependent peptidase ImmA (M78 family)
MLSFQPTHGKPGSAENVRFESRHLVTTNCAGQGTSGITAQVDIPQTLPLYGTAQLKGFPINVRISKNSADYPESFCVIMAHELSHVVLHSICHVQRHNEFYTDLSAMILGFSKIMRNGRKVSEENRTTNFGYLTDQQFDFAVEKVNKLLRDHRNRKSEFGTKVQAYSRAIRASKKALLRFHQFLKCLDQRRHLRMPITDSRRIISFHDPTYAYKFEASLKTHEKTLQDMESFHQTFVHYTSHSSALLQRHDAEVQTLYAALKETFEPLHKDIKLLKGYVGLWNRLKVQLQAFLRDTTRFPKRIGRH